MDEAHRKERIRWARDIIISVVLVPTILAYLKVSPPVIILGAVGSLVVLFLWERYPVNVWGPWVLIIGGPIAGAIWLYIASPNVFTVQTKHAAEAAVPPPASTSETSDTKLLERTRHLSPADRQRLSGVFYDLTEAFSVGNKIVEQAHRFIQDMRNAKTSSVGIPDPAVETYQSTLTSIREKSASFDKTIKSYFEATQYYEQQIRFVLGNDPNPSDQMSLAASYYITYLKRWSSIKNRETEYMTALLDPVTDRFAEQTDQFNAWLTQCERRLSTVKEAVQ